VVLPCGELMFNAAGNPTPGPSDGSLNIKVEPKEVVLPCGELMFNAAGNPTPGPSGAAILRCGHCGYMCEGRDQLHEHAQQNHGRMAKRGVDRSGDLSDSPRNEGRGGNMRAKRTCEDKARPHKCDVCEKTFKNRSHLVGHRRRHTG